MVGPPANSQPFNITLSTATCIPQDMEPPFFSGTNTRYSSAITQLRRELVISPMIKTDVSSQSLRSLPQWEPSVGPIGLAYSVRSGGQASVYAVSRSPSGRYGGKCQVSASTVLAFFARLLWLPLPW